MSEHLHTGLNEAEQQCFQEEWDQQWRPAPENLQKHQLRPRGAEIPEGQAKANKSHERKHKKEV